MFVRSVVTVTLSVKWVTIKDLSVILYETLCTKNWISSVTLLKRLDITFIIVTGQVLSDF
jgi:hypothetical protein